MRPPTNGRGLRRISVDLAPLRVSPAYRSLLAGQVISLIGTQMRYVAVAWQVFTLTGSSVAVGLLGLAEVIPLLVMSVFAGALADSHDRKMIMLWSQRASMVVAIALALLALTGWASLWNLYLLTALGATFDALDRPARTAVIPTLVGEANLAAAMTLRQISFQIAQVIGPAIGGLAIATLSLAFVYALDAFTFIFSLLSLRPLARSQPQRQAESQRVRIKEGFRFALRHPLIRGAMAVDLVAMTFGMPRSVFPALSENVFGLGASGAGLLYAAPSAGALIGALASGWVRNVSRYGRAIFIVVAIWGISIALAGLSTFSLPLMLSLLAVAGAADVLSAVFRGTMIQLETPDQLRGRVTALNTFVVVGGPRLGDVEAGYAAALLGPAGSVVSGGVLCLLGAAALFTRSSELRDYRKPKEEALHS